MLKITCYKCHWSWSYNREAVQNMLDSLDKDQDYFPAECPKCRRTNKVARNQLERALPRQRDST